MSTVPNLVEILFDPGCRYRSQWHKDAFEVKVVDLLRYRDQRLAWVVSLRHGFTDGECWLLRDIGKTLPRFRNAAGRVIGHGVRSERVSELLHEAYEILWTPEAHLLLRKHVVDPYYKWLKLVGLKNSEKLQERWRRNRRLCGPVRSHSIPARV